jgi:hypothetical protein
VVWKVGLLTTRRRICWNRGGLTLEGLDLLEVYGWVEDGYWEGLDLLEGAREGGELYYLAFGLS